MAAERGETGGEDRDGHERDWLTGLLIILTGGVITRRDEVLWSVTLADAQAWARETIKQRYEWVEILFGKDKKTDATDQFCTACRAAKRNKDCKSCLRNIEVRDGKQKQGVKC